MTLHMLAVLPLLSLAVYRVWRLVAEDTITEPIRARFLFRDGRVWEWVAELVTCVWCLGFWLSGVAVVAYLLVSGHGLAWLAIMWPAVSACVGIIARVVDRLATDG